MESLPPQSKQLGVWHTLDMTNSCKGLGSAFLPRPLPRPRPRPLPADGSLPRPRSNPLETLGTGLAVKTSEAFIRRKLLVCPLSCCRGGVGSGVAEVPPSDIEARILACTKPGAAMLEKT